MTVDLFAGPSFFFTNTDVLSSVTTTSSYPFDEAIVSGTSNVRLDDDPIGFNAGGALTWRLTEVFGLAFQARYSHGSIRIAREGADEIELDAGGFRVAEESGSLFDRNLRCRFTGNSSSATTKAEEHGPGARWSGR